MSRPVVSGKEEILHSIGELTEATGNQLRVRVHSEFCIAESSEDLYPGDNVKVAGMEDLKLKVKKRRTE